MENLIKTISYKGYTIEIGYDSDDENPREYQIDHELMAFFHKRHNLGDTNTKVVINQKTGLTMPAVPLRTSDFNSFDEMQDYIEKKLRGIFITPVYMYEHSGIVLSTGPFSDPWDSGMIGFMYTTRSKLQKWYGRKQYNLKDQKFCDRVENRMEEHLKFYSHWLNGDLKEFRIYDASPDNYTTGDEVDRAGGYEYTDACIDAAKLSVDEIEANKLKKQLIPDFERALSFTGE